MVQCGQYVPWFILHALGRSVHWLALNKALVCSAVQVICASVRVAYAGALCAPTGQQRVGAHYKWQNTLPVGHLECIDAA